MNRKSEDYETELIRLHNQVRTWEDSGYITRNQASLLIHAAALKCELKRVKQQTDKGCFSLGAHFQSQFVMPHYANILKMTSRRSISPFQQSTYVECEREFGQTVRDIAYDQRKALKDQSRRLSL